MTLARRGRQAPKLDLEVQPPMQARAMPNPGWMGRGPRALKRVAGRGVTTLNLAGLVRSLARHSPSPFLPRTMTDTKNTALDPVPFTLLRYTIGAVFTS